MNATLPVALCMMEAARDFHRDTGRPVGVKVAGGVRTAKQAIQYLVLLYETLGSDWMTPERFRIGASIAPERRADADREGTHRADTPGRTISRSTDVGRCSDDG